MAALSMQRRSPFAETGNAIADAAARWCDADFPPRVRAQQRVAQRTGYSIPVVEHALDRLFGSMSRDGLLATIDAEIGGRRVVPIGSVAIVSSRTTIGVAIVPAIFAICAGCEVLVKDREDALVGAFFETLAEELVGPSTSLADARYARDDRAWASLFSAEAWTGAARDLSRFDCVVAFGGDDALRAIRAACAPSARFIGYGPKASIGYVTREALRDEAAAARVAAGAARDLVLYDGEGCLSLHALFVERRGAVTAERFMELLAGAVEQACVEFPLGERSNDAAARVAAARDLAIFRGGPVFSDAGATFLITGASPDRAPEFLPRALAVHPVDAPAEMLDYVRRHRLPIEACAVSEARDEVAAAALAAGANRLAPFGELQNPPISSPHGGRPRIAEFLRFIEDGA